MASDLSFQSKELFFDQGLTVMVKQPGAKHVSDAATGSSYQHKIYHAMHMTGQSKIRDKIYQSIHKEEDTSPI